MASTEETDNKILIKLKEIATKPKKQLSKNLIHPFAAITFFHQAVRIGINDINKQLTDYNKTKDPLLPSKIYKSFEHLFICIDIHKEHDIDGLFPEIESSITNQLHNKIFDNTNFKNETELNQSLNELSQIIEKHNKDSKLIKQLKQLILVFVDKVEKNETDQDIDKLFKPLLNSIKIWIDYHLNLLQQEDNFLSSLIDHITDNKLDQIRMIKGILDGTLHLIIKHQLRFTISKLSKCNDWICPINKQHYVDNQVLAIYIHSLQLTSTEEEYETICLKIKQYLSSEAWAELKLYGLDNPGLFRYRKTIIRETSADFYCFEDLPCQCLFL